MLVSVVIPTYNRADMIRDTIQSVLDQTIASSLEIIVVDDGSTDDTHALIAELLDGKVRYYYQANGGAGSARNLGICAALGDYIAFLDSDDLWMPHKLELQLARLSQTGNAWAYCDAEMLSGLNQRTIGLYSMRSYAPHEGDVARPLLMGNFIASPTPLIRREVFEHVGVFTEDRDGQYTEDWRLWLRIAAYYPIDFVTQPLACYRVHDQSLTALQDPESLHRARMAALADAVSFAPQIYSPFLASALYAEYMTAGRSFLRGGRLSVARHHFAQAARQSPLKLSPYAFWLASLLGHDFVSALLGIRRRVGRSDAV